MKNFSSLVRRISVYIGFPKLFSNTNRTKQILDNPPNWKRTIKWQSPWNIRAKRKKR